MDPLHTVFANLDRWRHFPAYQLERRADIFFSVYLPEVLAEYTGVQIDSRIIPEFPLKLDLIWPGRPSSKSVKVDYVLFAEDRSKAYFVELKTDAASRRDTQDEYLSRSKELGFRTLVQGMTAIAQRTTAYQKYYHLLRCLEDLGFLSLPSALADHLFPVVRPGASKLLADIVVGPLNPAVEIIYLQPTETGNDATISFQTFADSLKGRTDPLSQLFADHLLRWQEEAGSITPQ
jgi:hypothetical protein